MSRNNNPPKHRKISRREFVKWDDMYEGKAAFQVVKKVMDCGSEFINLGTREGGGRSTDIKAVSFSHTPDQTDIYVNHYTDEFSFDDMPIVHINVRPDGTMRVIVERGGENVTVERRDA